MALEVKLPKILTSGTASVFQNTGGMDILLTLATCARVTVVVLCMSVCVCYRATCYISRFCIKCVPYCISIVCIVWIYAKTLCSRVLALFVGHRCLPRSLRSFRWIKETVLASYQLEGYVWLVIVPTRRLAHLLS